MEYRVIYRRDNVRNGTDAATADDAARMVEQLRTDPLVTDIVSGRN
jgi:hypothetical protein